MPAPRGNQNAAVTGLYARPERSLTVRADAQLPELAEYAETLALAAQWIAEELVQGLPVAHKDSRLITLYASVAGELAQEAAELQGAKGIKAAALGTLSEERFGDLMRRKAAALDLILNQVQAAFRYLKDHTEIPGGEHGRVVVNKGEFAKANAVLEYLAASIRAAKREIRDMAANRLWEMAGKLEEGDLGDRIEAAMRE